jgi:hypothetical protein
MPGEEFRGAVDNEVAAQCGGQLIHRRRKGVVGHHDAAVAFGGTAEPLDVDDLERGIGRSFEVQELAAAREFRLNFLDVGGIAQAHVDREPGQEFLEQDVRSAVGVLDADYPVARGKQREQR